jgi:hypothetical protein
MKSLLCVMFLLYLQMLSAASEAQVTCINQPTGLPVIHLAFTPPTSNTDGSALALPMTYNVYMGNAQGTEKLYKTGFTYNPITLKNLSHGEAYYLYLVAVDAKGNASGPSNEVCKTFYKK